MISRRQLLAVTAATVSSAFIAIPGVADEDATQQFNDIRKAKAWHAW